MLCFSKDFISCFWNRRDQQIDLGFLLTRNTPEEHPRFSGELFFYYQDICVKVKIKNGH